MTHRAGLVVAGAGARGTYEAGALGALLPRMAAHGNMPSVLVGTSAGSLNVVGIGGLAHLEVHEITRHLMSVWGSVELTDVITLTSGLGTGLRYLGQLAGLPIVLSSLLDTSRLRAKLLEWLPLEQLHENIRAGVVDAVAVTTTSIATGGTIVFVEKNASVALPPNDVGRNITYVETQLTVDHVMASAAVPMLFRPVQIQEPYRWRGWYVDGGLRLNTPMRPAIALGCDRLGVVTTMPMTSTTSPPPSHEHAGRGEPLVDDEPDVYAVAALTLRVLLADRMIEDLHRLSRRNALAHDNPEVPAVDILFAGPSASQRGDLADLANKAFVERYSGLRGIHNPVLWLLARLIGGNPADHGNLLSYLFFDPAFTERAAALGLEHARSQLSGA